MVFIFKLVDDIVTFVTLGSTLVILISIYSLSVMKKLLQKYSSLSRSKQYLSGLEAFANSYSSIQRSFKQFKEVSGNLMKDNNLIEKLSDDVLNKLSQRFPKLKVGDLILILNSKYFCSQVFGYENYVVYGHYIEDPPCTKEIEDCSAKIIGIVRTNDGKYHDDAIFWKMKLLNCKDKKELENIVYLFPFG